ncbi:hypothetical protein [Acinetobacter indicus]|uniref:hypothetical protein n=1 Tax=Acinetobacter indicus TaxID=756892 RepID=UPI00144408DC|nr:hypothetical protein [Acinetobacter indicus]
MKINIDLIYAGSFLLGSLSYLIYLKMGGFIFLSFFFSIGLIFLSLLKILKINKLLLLFFIFSIFIYTFLGFLSPNYEFSKLILSLLYIFSCIGYALILFFNKNNLILSKIIYLGFLVFLLFHFISMGFLSFEEFNNIFYASSRNVVSAALICLLLNLILISKINNKDLSFFYYLSCLLFCVLLYGRTGILISILLLSYKIITYFKNLYSVFLLVIFLFVGNFYLGYFLGFLENNTNLSKGLESPRSMLLNEYLNSIFLSNKNLLFGSDINKCCQYAVLFNENLHNSFLYAHSRFGIISFIYFILFTLFVFFTRNFLVIFIYCVLILRYFYDELGFFGVFDISFYILLIMCFVKYNLIVYKVD